MSENQIELKPTDSPNQVEYHVQIDRHGYGYVKVLARSKNEAEEVVKKMNQKRLMNYYNEKCEFITIGEAYIPDDRH